MTAYTVYRCPTHGIVPAVQTVRTRKVERGFKHVPGCGLVVEVTTTIECVDHHAEERLGYLEWHERAEELMKQGVKQTQCRECRLWFYPWERK